MITTTYEDFTITLGKNQNENDEIIKNSNQNDLWFHLANFPSCHAVIKCHKEPGIDVITFCANLVKENTKYKNLRNIKVNYLPIKFVKRTKVPGKVVLLKKPKSLKN